MIPLVLVLGLLPLWSGSQLPFRSRPGLPVQIRAKANRVILEAPQAPAGQIRAWTALEKAPRLTEEERVHLWLRGNGWPVRFSLFFLIPESELYRWKDTTLTVPDSLTRLTLPLTGARKVYTSNFPGALSPSGHAPLILIVENAAKGPFYLEILRLELEDPR